MISVRSNSEITIWRLVKRPTTVVRVPVTDPVPITEKSVRRFSLMKEDFVQLDFSLPSAVHFAIGDFIEDDIFGTFYMTQEQMPKYNANTGGYDYSLHFDADYMLWKNWMHCLTVNVNGGKQRMESEWGLTDQLSVHAQQVADEVNLLIPGGSGYRIVVHNSAEKASEIHFLAYSGKSILDSLNMIADTWQCEWWVTHNDSVIIDGVWYNSVIHFGKMDNGNTPYEFRLGENVESMDVTRDQQSFATRIYAYGGTQNIPEDYDRKLEFTVTSLTEEGFLDEGRPLDFDMIDGELNVTVYDFTLGDAMTIPATVVSGGTKTRTYRQQGNANTLRGKNKLYGTLASTLSLEGNDDFAAVDVPDVTATAKMKYGANEVSVPVTLERRGRVMWYAEITLDGDWPFGEPPVSVNFELTWKVETAVGGVHENDEAAIDNMGMVHAYNIAESLKEVRLTYNGVVYEAWFHGATGRITFKEGVTVPDDWGEGKVYMLEPLTISVPLSYYTPIYDTGTLSKVGDRRLHLPLSRYPNRYLPAEDPTDMSQCVEMAVIFNEVFHKLHLRIKAGSLRTELKRQKVEHSDNSVSWENWTQYSFSLEYCINEEDNSWADFQFKIEYMLDGAKLQAAFTAPKRMQQQGFMLSGMTFDVGFNYNSQRYTIIRNEDYGVKLPNDLLKPSEGDELFLTGWNPKAMKEMHLVDIAESELADKGNAYFDAIMEGQFTFTCRMMSDWPFSLAEGGLFLDKFSFQFQVRKPDGNGDPLPDTEENRQGFEVEGGGENFLLPSAGDRVTVYHDALPSGSKESRIIGYEYRLDKPYDTPTYTVGETEAYSRLKQIEKTIQKLS